MSFTRQFLAVDNDAVGLGELSVLHDRGAHGLQHVGSIDVEGFAQETDRLLDAPNFIAGHQDYTGPRVRPHQENFRALWERPDPLVRDHERDAE